ncbi:redoxin domain-containing protein [Nocardioides sp. 31GB23]|uniref:TlpA family protein disulfide reductase n=1 Tax=Nocardioides sp. 31GB23 TaxID=3156065 RepID=UPI0032AF6B3F
MTSFRAGGRRRSILPRDGGAHHPGPPCGPGGRRASGLRWQHERAPAPIRPTPSTATDDAASPPAAGTADSPGNPGNPLYDVSSSTIDGADWDGADLAGKPAVLWFWAPWCPTCRAQVSGVGELAASVDPAVTNLSDADGSVWRHYGVTAQSTYLVLDADGEVRAEGYLDEAELAGIVDDLVEQAG